MYLTRDDLKDLLEFLNKFPTVNAVEVEYDNTSGIGATVIAHVHNVSVEGMDVTVTKEISGVENW